MATRRRESRSRTSPLAQITINHDPNVIELSSDDDVPSVPSTRKASVPPSTRYIVEISDDEDEPPAKVLKTSDLQSRLKRLQKEKEKLESDNVKMQAEILDLKSKTQGSSALSSELEESISCQICTVKLWSPYTLPECGHTFCQTCLQDWLRTTLAQHMQAHPDYRGPSHIPQLPLFNFATQFGLDHRQQARLAEIFDRTPKPSYTCPACREPVINRPVEVFALKSVVRAVAKAEGETSPRKEPQRSSRKNKRAAPSQPSSPWDEFFGKKNV